MQYLIAARWVGNFVVYRVFCDEMGPIEVLSVVIAFIESHDEGLWDLYRCREDALRDAV